MSSVAGSRCITSHETPHFHTRVGRHQLRIESAAKVSGSRAQECIVRTYISVKNSRGVTPSGTLGADPLFPPNEASYALGGMQ